MVDTTKAALLVHHSGLTGSCAERTEGSVWFTFRVASQAGSRASRRRSRRATAARNKPISAGAAARTNPQSRQPRRQNEPNPEAPGAKTNPIRPRSRLRPASPMPRRGTNRRTVGSRRSERTERGIGTSRKAVTSAMSDSKRNERGIGGIGSTLAKAGRGAERTEARGLRRRKRTQSSPRRRQNEPRPAWSGGRGQGPGKRPRAGAERTDRSSCPRPLDPRSARPRNEPTDHLGSLRRIHPAIGMHRSAWRPRG
jgi:hypothetical protein